MSDVTNTILTFPAGTDKKILNKVNKFFDETGFVNCDGVVPGGWYGGTKMLETNICIGAFNHLDIEGLVKHLEAIDWERPNHRCNVQLIIQEQWEDEFRIITI